MKLGLSGIVLRVLGTAVVACLAGAALAGGQSAGPAAPKPPMAEDYFKNIQVLKGVPVDQFMGTMGFIAASLSVNCTECHVADYSVDTTKKKRARQMMLMMNDINKNNFGGARSVTCYTCHRSDLDPKVTPSLVEQYGMPPDPDPNDIEIIGKPDPSAPAPEKVFDRYIDALGGTQKLAALTSFTATGTYSGFDTDLSKVPADFYAKAPNMRTTMAHRSNAEDVNVFDGSTGWVAMTNTRLPLLQLSGGNLEGAEMDAALTFPSATWLKAHLTRLRTGYPPLSIDDHDVDIVGGTTPGGMRVKLYFDSKTGLLVRTVRFNNTLIGFIAMQVDYGDYRDVQGVKVPFHMRWTWTDGRSDYDITEIHPNAKVDAKVFDQPAIVAAPAGAFGK